MDNLTHLVDGFGDLPKAGPSLERIAAKVSPEWLVDWIENPKRFKWQRRLEPVWKRIAGNCHMTRTTDQAIPAAGFELVEARRESIRKLSPLLRTSTRGLAVKPTP